MERRRSARKRIAVDVYLAGPGQRMRRGRARNISTGGVYVETPAPTMRKGSTLDLVFVLNRGSVIKIHRLPAFVTRVCTGGAAMMLYRNTRLPT